jgi:hypothetical protein
MADKFDNAILSNLEKLKQESYSIAGATDENEQKESEKLAEKLTRVTEVKRSDFDFESKRLFFDDVYFKSSKIFRVNSKEYNDFWDFVKKYQAMMKRRPASQSTTL